MEMTFFLHAINVNLPFDGYYKIFNDPSAHVVLVIKDLHSQRSFTGCNGREIVIIEKKMVIILQIKKKGCRMLYIYGMHIIHKVRTNMSQKCHRNCKIYNIYYIYIFLFYFVKSKYMYFNIYLYILLLLVNIRQIPNSASRALFSCLERTFIYNDYLYILFRHSYLSLVIFFFSITNII